MTRIRIDGAEALGDFPSLLIGTLDGGDKDDIPLITLDVLQVLDKERFQSGLPAHPIPFRLRRLGAWLRKTPPVHLTAEPLSENPVQIRQANNHPKDHHKEMMLSSSADGTLRSAIGRPTPGCSLAQFGFRVRTLPTGELFMNFQAAYETWIQQQSEKGSPERRRKLRSGLGFAEHAFLEHVWWPTVGNFTNLHPEYEVADYSGAPRFLDFAYLRGGLKLAIEIDGYTTHAKNLNRRQVAYQLHRQNMLTLDGWDILRFAFDDIEAHPRRCQQTIQQYMGSRFAATPIRGHHDGRWPQVTTVDREIIRLARSLPRPLLPADICRHLGVSRYTAYRHLKRLVTQGVLVPASGSTRIRTYQLAATIRHSHL